MVAFCGYYALVNYLGEEIDIDLFRERVYEAWRNIGIPDAEIANYIQDAGTLMETLAVGIYGFTESQDVTSAIQTGRFMAATGRYGGHWMTYRRDNDGKWWEYDSWKSRPTRIGGESQLLAYLRNVGLLNVYYR